MAPFYNERDPLPGQPLGSGLERTVFAPKPRCHGLSPEDTG